MCVCKRYVTYIDVFLPGIWVCYLKLSFHLEFPIIRTCVLLVSFSLFFLSAVILKCAGSASGSCYCRWLFCDNIYVACSSAGLALASSASLFQAALLLTVNTELSHQMSREHVFLGSWLWSVPSSARVIAVPKPCLIPPGGIYQGFLAGNTQKVGHMGTAPSVCLFLKIADLQLRGEKKKKNKHRIFFCNKILATLACGSKHSTGQQAIRQICQCISILKVPSFPSVFLSYAFWS